MAFATIHINQAPSVQPAVSCANALGGTRAYGHRNFGALNGGGAKLVLGEIISLRTSASPGNGATERLRLDQLDNCFNGVNERQCAPRTRQPNCRVDADRSRVHLKSSGQPFALGLATEPKAR